MGSINAKNTQQLIPNNHLSQNIDAIIQDFLITNLDSAQHYIQFLKNKTFKKGNNKTNKKACEIFLLEGTLHQKKNERDAFVEKMKLSADCYKANKNLEKEVEVKKKLARWLAQNARLGEAKQAFEECRKLYLKLDQEENVANTTMKLGTLNMMLDKNSEGIEKYLMAYNYYEKNKKFGKLTKLCGNIGTAYNSYVENNIDRNLYVHKALEYFKKGIAFSEQPEVAGNKKVIRSKTYILVNMASLYGIIGQHDLSITYLNQVIELADQGHRGLPVPLLYHEKALAYLQLKKYSDALSNVNECISAAGKDLELKVSAYKTKSEILSQLSRPQEAFQSCLLCKKTSLEVNSLFTKKIALECLSEAAKQLGQYKNAYGYMIELQDVNNSIYKEAKVKNLNAVEQQFVYEQEKAQLQQRNEVNKIRLTQQQLRTKILSFIFILSILGLGLLGYIYKKNKEYAASTQLKNKEIQEKNEALQESNGALGIANEKLNNFTSVAAHDLKAPLRTISSFAQLLKMRNSKNLEPKDLEMLGFVSTSAKELSNMVDDLLAFSNLDKDLGPPIRLDINDLVASVNDSLGISLKEENATVEVSSNLSTVMAHSGLIKQLFQNIIANGIKFKREGINPHIKIKKEKENAESITYSISDNGIGIDEKYHKEIFSIFKRLNGQKKYAGSGIGLATCKSIVDYYNQEITVKSELNKGTTFIFSLPKPPKN